MVQNPTLLAKTLEISDKLKQQAHNHLSQQLTLTKKISLDLKHPRSSLICYIADEEPHLVRDIIAHLTVILSLGLMVFMLVQFIRKRHHFPIRERAPKLAILQGMMFMGAIVVPYLIDILVATTKVWQSEGSGRVKLSRKLVKALFVCFRINMYLAFILR